MALQQPFGEAPHLLHETLADVAPAPGRHLDRARIREVALEQGLELLPELTPGSPSPAIAQPTPTTARAPYAFVPPFISTLPSGMIDMPLQNMSQAVGMLVILLMDKSSSAAP